MRKETEMGIFNKKRSEETGHEDPVSFDDMQVIDFDEQQEVLPDTEIPDADSDGRLQDEKKNAGGKKGGRPFLKGMFSGMALMLVICVLLMGVYLVRSGSMSSILVSSASGDAASLSEVLDEASLEKMEALLELLNFYYYDSLSTEDLQEGIYEGLISGVGDDYTVYYTADEMESLNVDMSGSYSGIGAVITVDGETNYPMVSYTYDGSPAQEAGLLTGDLFLQVDDMEVTSESSTSDVAAKIRGEAGTSVHIVVQRGSEELEVDIVRADIDTPSIESMMLDDGVGYIYILQFSSNTEEQFMEAYEELTAEGMTSMILDLRYNGGGTVSSCVEILDDILPEGVTLTMDDALGGTTQYTSDAENYIDIPIALLVNGSSASASEIVTAALMDYDYATVIGTTTYGKGVYQQTWTLTDGSGIKITIGKFYSPDGYNYDGVGIEPDIVLEYENTAGEDADYAVETDNQIQKAIEVLTEAAQ